MHNIVIRRMVVALALAAALAGAMLLATATKSDAAATNSGCITRAESGHVKKGMTINRAHQIIGGSGKQQMLLPGYPSLGIKAEQIRQYKQCGSFGFSQVTYTHKSGNWFVKSQFKFFI